MTEILIASILILGVDLATVAIDPAADPAGAARSLVLGPAPSAYAPLVRGGTGLSVVRVDFRGNMTRSLASTAVGFHRNLFVDTELLEPGVFLGTGFGADARPPDGSGSTSGFHSSGRSDPLAEVLTGGAWSYDAQRLVIELDAGPATNSLAIRWVFGTEEFPEYVGSTYNDAFGIYLFEDGERGPAGGLFWSAPPSYRDLCDTPDFQLTDPQRDFLRAHQIAFDAQGFPITVNGPFFSTGQVIRPPLNDLEFDGSTRILKTVASLRPGARHAIYIVIADTDDSVYDSCAFLSFEGSPDVVTETETTSGTIPGGGAPPGPGTVTGSSSGTGTGTGTGTTGGGSSTRPVGAGGCGFGGGAGAWLPMAALLGLYFVTRSRQRASASARASSGASGAKPRSSP